MRQALRREELARLIVVRGTRWTVEIGTWRLGPVGSVAAVAGVSVGVILVFVDGVAAEHLADAWEAAPTEEAAAVPRVAEEAINFALASLFNILFAGLTFILLGLAVAFSGKYPG
jgi:hypothetical protein